MFKTIYSIKVKLSVFLEVERLVILGVLERTNDSQWGDPSITQPRRKINQVGFISDFRNLNE